MNHVPQAHQTGSKPQRECSQCHHSHREPAATVLQPRLGRQDVSASPGAQAAGLPLPAHLQNQCAGRDPGSRDTWPKTLFIGPSFTQEQFHRAETVIRFYFLRLSKLH